MPEEANRPFFQGFRQEGVIGVCHGRARDLPSAIPRQTILVHQNPHQLRDSNRGVGIIELEDILFGKLTEVLTMDLNPGPHDILKTCTGQKVLLAQPQLLAVFAGVIGIEHHRDVLGQILGAHRLGVISGIEFTQAEFIGGRGFPKSQRIDGSIIESRNRHIVRHCEDILRIDPSNTMRGIHLGSTAKTYPRRQFRAFKLPHMTIPEPVIGFFQLMTGFDQLAKHAVFIADTVAGHGQLKRCTAVEEAGGKPSKTPVPQSRIVLDFR